MSGIIEKLREENAFLNDMLENAHNRSRLLEQQLAQARREGWEQAKAEVERLENYITTWRMDYTKMELEQTKLTIATEALESLISANTQRITTARYIARTALERIKE